MRVLLYGINIGDKPASHLHIGKITQEEKEFLKENGFDVITFDLLGMSDIKFLAGESIFSVLEKLPAGWEPDFILIQGPEYLILPARLNMCEYPVVFATCDFDYEIQRAMHLFRVADSVICYSDETREIAEKLGARHTIKFPIWFGYDTEDEKLKGRFPTPDERDIDILYTGYISPVSQDKEIFISILHRIAFRNKLRFKVSRGYIPRDEYPQKLMKAKLVFTYHRRGEIQRPEAILYGASLITNSREFSDMFVEDEDFFVYRSQFSILGFSGEKFAKLDESEKEVEEIVLSALEKIKKVNWKEREKRILSLRESMKPRFRLLEMLRTIEKSLPEIKGKAKERLNQEKLYQQEGTEKQNTPIEWRKRKLKTDIFSVMSLSPLIRPSREQMRRFFEFFVKLIDEGAERSGINIQDEVDLLTNKITLLLSSKPEGSGNIEKIAMESIAKHKNFLTALNLATLKFQSHRFHEALRYIELAMNLLMRYGDESLKHMKDIIFAPSTPLIIWKDEIFFGEISELIIQALEKGEITNKTEELKKTILSYLNFVKGLCLRKMGYRSSEFLKFAVNMFPAKYMWRLELVKSLISEEKTDEALENSLTCMKTAVNQDVAEALTITIFQSDRKTLEEKIKQRWDELRFLLKSVYEIFSQDKILNLLEKKIFGEIVENKVEDKKPRKKALVISAFSDIQSFSPFLMWLYDNIFSDFDILIFAKEEIKDILRQNVQSITKQKKLDTEVFAIGVHPEKSEFSIHELKEYVEMIENKTGKMYSTATIIPEGVMMNDMKLLFDYTVISNSEIDMVVSDVQDVVQSSDGGKSTPKIVSVRMDYFLLSNTESGERQLKSKEKHPKEPEVLLYKVPSGKLLVPPRFFLNISPTEKFL